MAGEMKFPRAGKSAEMLIVTVYRNATDFPEVENNVLGQKTETMEALWKMRARLEPHRARTYDVQMYVRASSSTAKSHSSMTSKSLMEKVMNGNSFLEKKIIHKINHFSIYVGHWINKRNKLLYLHGRRGCFTTTKFTHLSRKVARIKLYSTVASPKTLQW